MKTMTLSPGMKRLARVTLPDHSNLDVFWDDDRHCVLYKKGSRWFAQGDCNIVRSIRNLQSGTIEQVMVFDQQEHHGRSYDTPDFADCDWSDFACDSLVLHFTVRPGF